MIQLTGLSGAGKTAIARYLNKVLGYHKLKVEIIDGDDYRKTLCKDLGFSKKDRQENIRRLGRTASLAKNRDVVIISAINPYEEVRRELREKYGAKTIWVNCHLSELIKRDTKGLYKRSMLPDKHPDRIDNFTGISDTYEKPYNADLIVHTDKEDLAESSKKIFDFINGILKFGIPPPNFPQ